jgi:hypothetical protein
MNVSDLLVGYAGRYWDLANAITAFSGVQAITFTYSSRTEALAKELAKTRGWVVALILTWAFVGFYGYGVWECRQGEVQLLRAASVGNLSLLTHDITRTAVYRIWAIIVINLLTATLAIAGLIPGIKKLGEKANELR